MIKKLLSIALVVVSISANAQQFKFKAGQAKLSTKYTVAARGVNPSPATVTIDTLMPASVMAGGCGLTGGLYNYICDAVSPPHDSGYIFGTGILPIGGGMSTITTECAQKYNASSTGTTVTDILVLAGAAHGGTVTTVGKVYTENAASHKPNTLLGTSSTVAMSAYTTTGYTAFHFVTAVAVPVGNFFASVTVPAFGGVDLDTLSILSTQLGTCPAPGGDSCSALKFGAPINGWYLVQTGFGVNGDLMIFPVINITTAGINSYVNKGNLNLYAASPNPASNSININFSLANTSKVEIEVYDVAGKVIKTIKGNTEYAVGKNSINVDVTNLDSGSYIYSITTNGAKMFSRFVVAK
jgi:hypothetical protein